MKSSSEQTFRTGGLESCSLSRSYNNPLLDDDLMTGGCNCTNHMCRAQNDYGKEIKLLLKEMRFLTKRLRDKDEEDLVIGDWKFAAMVIDRFCLIGLTGYTILTTVILLTSAPHIVVP